MTSPSLCRYLSCSLTPPFSSWRATHAHSGSWTRVLGLRSRAPRRGPCTASVSWATSWSFLGDVERGSFRASRTGTSFTWSWWSSKVYGSTQGNQKVEFLQELRQIKQGCCWHKKNVPTWRLNNANKFLASRRNWKVFTAMKFKAQAKKRMELGLPCLNRPGRFLCPKPMLSAQPTTMPGKKKPSRPFSCLV